jgi:hypothetical protein
VRKTKKRERLTSTLDVRYPTEILCSRSGPTQEKQTATNRQHVRGERIHTINDSSHESRDRLLTNPQERGLNTRKKHQKQSERKAHVDAGRTHTKNPGDRGRPTQQDGPQQPHNSRLRREYAPRRKSELQEASTSVVASIQTDQRCETRRWTLDVISLEFLHTHSRGKRCSEKQFTCVVASNKLIRDAKLDVVRWTSFHKSFRITNDKRNRENSTPGTIVAKVHEALRRNMGGRRIAQRGRKD